MIKILMKGWYSSYCSHALLSLKYIEYFIFDVLLFDFEIRAVKKDDGSNNYSHAVHSLKQTTDRVVSELPTNNALSLYGPSPHSSGTDSHPGLQSSG